MRSVISYFKPFLRLVPICALLGTPLAAHASMVFCNHTPTPIEAAIGYKSSKKWVSEGWWRIEPGLCARVVGKALAPQNVYFYYAHTLMGAARTKPPFIWDGGYRFCAAKKAFKIEGVDNCEKLGFETKGFRPIELPRKTDDYILNFGNGAKAIP